MITTANCLQRKKPKDLEVLVGTDNWKEGGTRYNVSALLPHEQFDIAMVRIKCEIIFSSSVQSIEYSKEEVQPNSIVQLSKF